MPLTALPSLFAGWPFWATWLVFLGGAMVRGQATYWLGRWAGMGVGRVGRFRSWLQQLSTGRPRQLVHRIGPAVVSLCYLTIGLQTAVIAACGVVRMRWWVFTVAQVPGAIAWATIYTTIGFAAFRALAWVAAKSSWGTAIFALLGIVAVIWWTRRRAAHPRVD